MAISHSDPDSGGSKMSCRFSADQIPLHQLLPIGRNLHAREWPNSEFEISGDALIRCEADIHDLPGLRIASISSPSDCGSHGCELVCRCDRDEIVFAVAARNALQLTWRGQAVSVADGEAALMPAEEPGNIGLPQSGWILMYGVPVTLLKPLVPDLGDHRLRIVPRANEALRLLLGYTELVLAAETGVTQSPLHQVAAAHMRGLIALAIGAERDGTAVAEGRGSRATRLEAIKADIVRNAASSKLSIGDIAKRNSMSPRSIQMLFEADGTTFSQFVLDQRLMLARQALSNSQTHRLSIAEIALDSGFSDISYFNRTFRRRFGTSPRQLRATG